MSVVSAPAPPETMYVVPTDPLGTGWPAMKLDPGPAGNDRPLPPNALSTPTLGA